MIAHSIPQLDIEQLDNGCLRLENTHCGETYAVDVHPCQLRVMAEMAGLLADVSASDAELLRTERGRLAEMSRDVDRLKRYLLRIRGHGLQLQHNFKTGADWDHADLTFEMGQINTLVDLLDMAVDDFADDYVGNDPEPYKPMGIGGGNPTETQRVSGLGAGPEDGKAGDGPPSKRAVKVVTVTAPAGTAQPALI